MKVNDAGHMAPQHVDSVKPDYRHCPKCGAELVLRQVKDGEPERQVCRACEYIFYHDPKVAVGTICLVENKILLLQRAIDPGYGKWVYPGGYVDWGERVEDAALREAQEEANVQVRLDRLLNVYSYTGRGVIVIVFIGTVVGGEPLARDETLALRLVTPQEIPWDELAFPSTRAAFQDYLAL